MKGKKAPSPIPYGGNKMEDCLFCKIVKGEVPATKVYEDEEILAFKDINPMAPVHILVIPKKHYNDISEITEADANIIAKIHLVINKIAKEQGIAETGYRIINNCKEDGGQEVKHLHFHLIGGKKLGTKMC